ncbi:MAG: hypothetical protein WKF97_12845 [Chitinophagaceae bacterium]
MKKLLLLVLLAIGPFTISQVIAQKDSITSMTATVSKGYTVLNSVEPIVIYKYMHRAHSPKEAEKYGPKYFFTTKSSDVLKKLTKENLKKSFPTDHAFHDALDANFKQDAELINYDDFHKMYKVNRLLQNSNK